MAFPPAFLDELRARLSLSDIIGKRIRLVRAGREMKGCCPFHNEKTPSFYVNDDKQFFHCFGCGAHGDIIGFTMRHDGLSFPEAVEALAGQAGVPVPRDTPIEREKFDLEKRLSQLLERAAVFFEAQLFAPAGREAHGYFRQRGLSDDAMRRFRLGYAPQDGQALIRQLTGEGFKLDELASVGLIRKAEDRPDHYSFFRHRAMFPVADRRGHVVAFGGRVLGEGEPKYLNSPDHPLFHKGKLLYNLSRARAAIGHNQPLIVAEGYMDVIALAEAGFTGAVAPLGTALTEDQLTVLWKLLPNPDARDPARDYSPILCFDGDGAGQRAASRAVERALPLLTPAQTLRVALLPEGQDPDDLLRNSGRAAVELVLKQARSMIDMIWDLTLAGRSLRTPEDRGAFTTAVKQKASRIAHEELRRLYQEDVAKRLNDLLRPAAKQQAQGSWGGQNGKASGRFGAGKTGQGKFGGGNGFKPAEPVIARARPADPQRLREKILLALMLNYPALFEEFGEDLARIECKTPGFEGLKQRLITILSLDSHEPLDAAELYRHLSLEDSTSGGDQPVRACLAAILSAETYRWAAYTRPGQPLEQARLGWKAVWGSLELEELEAEMKNLRRLLAAHYSEDGERALGHLRDRHAALQKDLYDFDAAASA